MKMDMVEQFFAFATERHLIFLRRAAGDPYPWTQDPVLQRGRFTNVYRELDRTTLWFKKHVREPMRSMPEVLLATIVFRWFNRTSTGEAIFLQTCLPGGPGEPSMTAFEEMLAGAKTAPLKHSILKYCGKGPYVTGAYTINTRSAGLGLSKLDGVLKLIDMWLKLHDGGEYEHWRVIAQDLMGGGGSMEEFCNWARSPCLAGFMTYEVACDLRHTDLGAGLSKDCMTWANPGPGAIRGLNRIHGRKVSGSLKTAQAIDEMEWLLRYSQHYWPRFSEARLSRGRFNVPECWPSWEMREVEHTLCEFDKYLRVTAGQGQTRGVFRP